MDGQFEGLKESGLTMASGTTVGNSRGWGVWVKKCLERDRWQKWVNKLHRNLSDAVDMIQNCYFSVADTWKSS